MSTTCERSPWTLTGGQIHRVSPQWRRRTMRRTVSAAFAHPNLDSAAVVTINPNPHALLRAECCATTASVAAKCHHSGGHRHRFGRNCPSPPKWTQHHAIRQRWAHTFCERTSSSITSTTRCALFCASWSTIPPAGAPATIETRRRSALLLITRRRRGGRSGDLHDYWNADSMDVDTTTAQPAAACDPEDLAQAEADQFLAAHPQLAVARVFMWADGWRVYGRSVDYHTTQSRHFRSHTQALLHLKHWVATLPSPTKTKTRVAVAPISPITAFHLVHGSIAVPHRRFDKPWRHARCEQA